MPLQYVAAGGWPTPHTDRSARATPRAHSTAGRAQLIRFWPDPDTARFMNEPRHSTHREQSSQFVHGGNLNVNSTYPESFAKITLRGADIAQTPVDGSILLSPKVQVH